MDRIIGIIVLDQGDEPDDTKLYRARDQVKWMRLGPAYDFLMHQLYEDRVDAAKARLRPEGEPE